MNKYFKENLFKKKASLKAVIFLKVKANSAVSGPPLGGLLGQYSIAPASFCEQFNSRTATISNSILLQVTIFLNISGEYHFDISLPNYSFFFKKSISLLKGVSDPGYISVKSKSKQKVNYFLSSFMVYEILLQKSRYENILELDFESVLISTIKRFQGTLLSMGIHLRK